MYPSPVLVFSRGAVVPDLVRQIAPHLSLNLVRCLAHSRRPEDSVRVVVDQTDLCRVCLRILRSLSMVMDPCRLILIPPARPRLDVVTVHPGAPESPSPPLQKAASAWRDRIAMLSPEGRSEAAGRFLALARERAHKPMSVTEAAGALGVSVRQLGNLCNEWFGHGPGMVIDVARISLVALRLTASSSSIASIASGYGFPDRRALNRRFVQFTGVSPSRYRHLHDLLRPLAEVDTLPELSPSLDKEMTV